MYYRSIGSGLGIGRYSKSNDSDSDSRAKKPDRDIPSKHTLSQSNIPSDELLNEKSLLIMKLFR